jgi:hypothetical protein
MYWDAFFSFVRVEVGGVSQTRFRHAVWSGDCSLKITFLELFCLARKIDAWGWMS